MSLTLCLSPTNLGSSELGGHLWVYLNWALGFRSLGCRVVWLLEWPPAMSHSRLRRSIAVLRDSFQSIGVDDELAVYRPDGVPVLPDPDGEYLDLEAAITADLLLNQDCGLPSGIVARFRRSALLDIDPGLLQLWIHGGNLQPAPHDVYFTIGETVGRPGARFPDGGLRWLYTPPAVATDHWPVCGAAPDAPFTTVSSWHGDEWMVDDAGDYQNDKRTGFWPFLELPRLTRQPLELALALAEDEASDRQHLERCGWRVRDAPDVAGSPRSYQRYVQQSRGEFSSVKPSCVRLENAWISDRTLCYLASGKPAVVRHTGPSSILPDAAGLFRFRDLGQAADHLEAAVADYDRHCRLARALAKEHFDARRVAQSLLERAL